MILRRDYLNKKATHREYYSQFVTDEIKALVTRHFGKVSLTHAYQLNEHFNNIKSVQWDVLTMSFSCDKKMREAGDYATTAGKVCILKEAARQVAEETLAKV